MRRFLLVCLMILVLPGCGSASDEMDKAIGLRNNLLQSNGYEFTAVITADYGTEIYTFTMDCKMDPNGALIFCVRDPDTISGISGQLSAEGGKLLFADTVLAFPLLADGELSPVSAPWVVMNTLRSGYISACGREGKYLKIGIADSYEADAMMLEILVDENNVLNRGEIFYRGRRILSVDIRNFVYL